MKVVRAGWIAVLVPVTLVAQSVARVEVTPATATLDVNGSTWLKALAFDSAARGLQREASGCGPITGDAGNAVGSLGVLDLGRVGRGDPSSRGDSGPGQAEAYQTVG